MLSPGVEIRAARAAETDEFLQVFCAAFQLDLVAARPIFYQDPFFDLTHKRLLRTERDGIVSCLTLVPNHIRIGQAWVPLAGIAGVATRPGQQGQGHGGRLLAATIAALSEELHYPLAGLFARSEELYRQLGWETATQAYVCTAALAPRPFSEEVAFARPYRGSDAADREAVRQLCLAAATAHTGGTLRDERRWRLIEAVPGRQCAVFQRPDASVTGYAIWEQDVAALRLLELCAATPDAAQGLIGWLQRQTSPHFPWSAPAEIWEQAGLPREEASMTAEPGMMLRIADILEAMRAVHAANLLPALVRSQQTLTLHAVDRVRPENNRPVRLTPSTVEWGQADDAGRITMDIRVLAQIYVGFRTPSEAARAGELVASTPQSLALADALFPRRAPWIALLDGF